MSHLCSWCQVFLPDINSFCLTSARCSWDSLSLMKAINFWHSLKELVMDPSLFLIPYNRVQPVTYNFEWRWTPQSKFIKLRDVIKGNYSVLVLIHQSGLNRSTMKMRDPHSCIVIRKNSYRSVCIPRFIEPDRVLSMGQIEQFDYLNCVKLTLYK